MACLEVGSFIQMLGANRANCILMRHLISYLVRNEPEEVETREQRRGKVHVLRDGLLEVVPLRQI